MTSNKQGTLSLLLVLLSFLIWGVTPIYFKWLDQVSAVELVIHRVIWSSVCLWGLLCAFGLWSKFKALWQDKQTRNHLFISSCLITGNWLVFVYAVVSEQTIEASLGYYINPLVSIALGAVFLGERLTRIQWLALALTVLAVAMEIWTLGTLSWVACALAASFALYGLVRKRLSFDPMAALAVETTWMLPLALLGLIYGHYQWDFMFFSDAISWSLPLMLAGVVTVVPLLLYVSGLPGVSLTIAGFAQYIAPSMVFLLAVYAFNEAVPEQRYWTFALVWCALILMSVEGLVKLRKTKV